MRIIILILSLFYISCTNSSTTGTTCTELEDCTGVCGGTTVVDACGVCGGNTNSEDDCPNTSCNSEVCITITNVNYVNNSLDIWLTNTVSVYGFQFNITGISNTVISGGLADECGFTVSTGGSTILGFDIGGGEIPPNSNGVLINVTFTDIDTTDDICIENSVFSDAGGNSLSIGTIDCFP